MVNEMVDRNRCFDEAENTLRFKLNENFKEILIINGYDNEVALSQIEESDLDNIELFVRNDYHFLLTDEEKSNIYGIYKQDPGRFKILSGIRKQITLISGYYKSKYATKSSQSTQTDTDFSADSVHQTPQGRQTVGVFTDIPHDSNSQSENIEIEKALITKALKAWLKVKVDKTKWNSFENKIDSIKLEIREGPGRQFSCNVTCFCGQICKILKVARKENFQPRWIYANAHKHFLNKHIIVNVLTAVTTTDPKPAGKTITDFFPSSSSSIRADSTRDPPSKSNSLIAKNVNDTCSAKHIHILQNISLKPPSTKTVDTPCNISEDSDNNMCLTEKLANHEIIETSSQSRVEKNNRNSTDLTEDLTNVQPLLSTPTKTSSVFEIPVSPISSNCSSSLSSTTSRWKTERYQRSERQKRRRDDIENNQLLITNFFPMVQKLSTVFDANPELIENIDKSVVLTETKSATGEFTSKNIKGLLEILCQVALKNTQKSKHKHTYDDVIKKLGLYIFYIGGRLLYEVLHANLKDTLPAISTLNRYVSDQNKYFEEGNFDFKNLKAFLDERELPSVIWIAEDGTRITGKIEYNPRNNTVMGFVLPLKNGLPVQNAYLATSSKVIQEYFLKCTKANYAYVIMAQPLSNHAPAYCLSVYGTDNKFTHKDVLQRWKFMEKEASRYGIKILGYSADGDTRLLKSMRLRTKIPTQVQIDCSEINGQPSHQPEWLWFQMPLDQDQCQSFIQDEVHIGTKLRNRLLKPNIILPIGDFNISIMHLQQLVETQPKDKHLLTMSDINPDDRMNFRSAEKIVSKEVLELLKEIPDSKGTISYLEAMRFTLDAFLSKNIALEDRIYYIWYAVFYFRIWRQWIKNHATYKLKDNFISDNAYMCIEINAHCLIKLIRIFRDDHMDSSMFCPWLFSSQSCERIFRSTRSMSTTFSTVVNFSIKDIILRIGRIKTVNNIIQDLKDRVIFPREKLQNTDENNAVDFSIFTDNYIENIVKRAIKDISKTVRSLGIESEAENYNCVSIKLLETLENDIKAEDVDSLHITEDEKRDDNQEKMFQNFVFENRLEFDLESELSTEANVGGSNLKDYSDKVKEVTENSPYVQIELENDKTAVIKKSTYCWLLEEEKGRVSADRLRRFFGGPRKRKGNKIQTDSTLKKSKRGAQEETTSEEEGEDNISYDDTSDTKSTDTETDSENIIGDIESQNKGSKFLEIRLEINQYYAVFYDEMWYVGRITRQHENDEYEMQFLRQNLDSFIWPKKTDIATVQKKFIFYGPIKLLGNNPFQIHRIDIFKINKMYKTFKKIHFKTTK